MLVAIMLPAPSLSGQIFRNRSGQIFRNHHGENDLRLGVAAEVVDLFDLPLERCEEALCNGVVPAVALAAHAALDPACFERTPVVAAGVGTAAIGVVDEARVGTAVSQCCPQGHEREVPVDRGAGCPAHDTPGEQIEHDGEVQPALPGPEVGDVRHPDLVGRGRAEVPLQHVRSDGKRVVRVGGLAEAAPRSARQAGFFHQPCDPFASDLLAGGAQLGVYARTAVTARAGIVRSPNAITQFKVASGPS
jgi:hypothetical protein